MNRFPILLAAALAAAPASAEDWRELAVTGEAIGFGDADSLTRDGDEVSLQVMLGLREAMGKDANIEFLASSMRISCATGHYFVDRVSGLGGMRAAVATLPGSREWKPVVAGTLYADFRDFACDSASVRAVADPFTATVQFWRPDEELIEAATVELAGDFHAG